MLCPDCFKNRKQVKLKVYETRPDGPFKRHRHYRCPECEFTTWNTESLKNDYETTKPQQISA